MNARARGFTLLEMLVAISVMTLLVSLVYGMLRMGSRSWESSAARIEATETMRIGWTFVQRALNNARAVPIKIPDAEGLHFIGDNDALEFVTDLPAYLGTGGLHAVGLGLEDEPDGQFKQLILYRIPLGDYQATTDNDSDPDLLQRAILAEGVEDMMIAYYGVDRTEDSDNEQAMWTSRWQAQPTLPILVKLVVSLADGDTWPLLIAHPQLGSGRQDDGTIDGEEPLDEHEITPEEAAMFDENDLQGEDLILFRQMQDRENNQ